MNPFSSNFLAEFAELLTTALLHFVWQGAVFVLLLLVAVRLFDVRTARRRYLLSVGALFMMGMAPIATAIWHQQAGSPAQPVIDLSDRSGAMVEEHAATGAIRTTDSITAGLSTKSAISRHPRIEVYVLITWLAGVSILSTRLAIGFGVTLWIRRHAIPLSDEFEQRVRMLSERLGMGARQRVFACARVGQAVAVGFVRPVVLVPAAWLTELSPQTIEAIIAHELAHLRRWDLWVNLAQRVVETLLFYHPAVWWLSSRIRLEREMCCDEIAAECFDRVSYARSLEAVAKIGRGNLLLATAIQGGTKMNLLRRVRYLLGLAPADGAGNWWAVGVVALILPLAAVVACSSSSATKPAVAKTEGKDTEKPGEKVAVEKITVASPQAKSVTVTQQYLGQIHAHRHIDVRAMQSGYLKGIPIKEGQAVKTGDVLLEIEPVLYAAKLQVAMAEEKLAQLELNRTKKLFEDKTVSANEVVQYSIKLDKARANVDIATAELNFTRIRAPFDGVVDHVPDLGVMVKEGEVLASLSDNSSVRVHFDVPETQYLAHVTDSDLRNEDLRIELLLSNGKKYGEVGEFSAIRADFDPQTGTIPFLADFPNPKHLLRHGQRGTVLISRVLNDVIVIPQRATFEMLAKRYVYVIDKENVAHRREIAVENEVDDLFVVKEGVGVDDKIIVGGVRQVHDGEKISPES
ncbi:MAG TPA: efflux RND transporter periplasmic adaptor subunit [Pirellulales bacterium]|nr:efflux RND transporter periplasmic adaptor subunit [Pirellulales bacterium]